MLSVLKVLWCAILLVFVPFFVGDATFIFKNESGEPTLEFLFYRYMTGFFVMLAIFEILCVPMCVLHVSFIILVVSYTLIMIAMVIFDIIYRIKKEKCFFLPKLKFELNRNEMFYTSVFVIMLLIQIYFAIFYGGLQNTYDDATYVARTTACLDTNEIIVDSSTVLSIDIMPRRVFNSWEVWMAWLCRLTAISPVAMAHTILNVALLLIAYMVYSLISCELFEDKEKRYIFMALVAFIIPFSYFSFYSPSAELLSTIWQGKSVVKMIVIPYAFYYIPLLLKRSFSYKEGIILALLTLATCGMTLTGAGLLLAIVLGVSCMHLITDRNYKKCIAYSVLGGTVPVIIMALYIVMYFI